jgi:hypothetical protein
MKQERDLKQRPGLLSALKTNQIDGLVADIATLLQAEEQHEGKILFRFGNP